MPVPRAAASDPECLARAGPGSSESSYVDDYHDASATFTVGTSQLLQVVWCLPGLAAAESGLPGARAAAGRPVLEDSQRPELELTRNPIGKADPLHKFRVFGISLDIPGYPSPWDITGITFQKNLKFIPGISDTYP